MKKIKSIVASIIIAIVYYFVFCGVSYIFNFQSNPFIFETVKLFLQFNLIIVGIFLLSVIWHTGLSFIGNSVLKRFINQKNFENEVLNKDE